MKIVGLQKLTLLDYPGIVACTVFLNGCNFRCPFCHNSELFEGNEEAIMSEEELLEFLKNRKGILEGVCITGGEPTLHPELVLLLKKIREMGYKIKLDTNGYRPAVLREVVEAGLIDYVAMDIKNAPEDYGWTAGIENPDLKKLEESIQYLVAGSVDYEFRTTVVDLFHDEASVKAMGEWLFSVTGGVQCKRWYIQPFVDRDTVAVEGLEAPEAKTAEKFIEILTSYARYTGLRGM